MKRAEYSVKHLSNGVTVEFNPSGLELVAERPVGPARIYLDSLGIYNLLKHFAEQQGLKITVVDLSGEVVQFPTSLDPIDNMRQSDTLKG
jgi:hypothetical protein